MCLVKTIRPIIMNTVTKVNFAHSFDVEEVRNI